GLPRFNSSRFQFTEPLHTVFAHCGHELLVLVEAAVNLSSRFQRGEDDECLTLLAVHELISSPMSIGYLLVGFHHQLYRFVPLFVMSWTQLKKRNLEIAHVRNIDRSASAVFLTINKRLSIRIHQQDAIGDHGAIQR